MSKFQTQEEYVDWAKKNHPGAIRELEAGRATITVAPNGFAWFGPEEGEVIVTFWFRVNYGKNDGAQWPLRLQFGEYELEYVRQCDDSGTAIYRRAREHCWHDYPISSEVISS